MFLQLWNLRVKFGRFYMIEIGRINIECGCENWWKIHLILLSRYHPLKVSIVLRWDELKACFSHSHLKLTLLNRLFFLLFLLHFLRLLLILNNWHFNDVFLLIWLLVQHEHNLIRGNGWFFCGLLGGFVGSCFARQVEDVRQMLSSRCWLLWLHCFVWFFWFIKIFSLSSQWQLMWWQSHNIITVRKYSWSWLLKFERQATITDTKWCSYSWP